MAKISNSLARSFAKAVIIQNGNDNTPKTLYGEVVQDEGVNYVRIDGSTELTPFSSVMDAVPGNRVSVTIDKGKATIVGNVSAPAQNTANFPQGSVNTACLYGPIDGDTLTIKNINASNIKSGTIDASLITVTNIDADSIKAGAITTDKLDANAVTAAKIASNAVTTDKLNANAVTADKIASNAITTDKLNANAVTTDKLNANAVTADKIASNAITTDKLNANAVTANKIASNAITADKIKAGEITSDHISTSGLSASVIESTSLNTAVGNIVTSTVDTSFIRKLVAGDITALGVSSQSMIIGSGDYGTVEIDGTLLQFKDNTQNHAVYIQLGKDTQGNNSLIIKNQNGDTIINSSGVTANAIANELIVDSMVKKRDANYTGISANALNIDSVVTGVVTGINSGTSTIKASKIYFDEESQTLNTKLGSLTASISGINTNLSTNYYTKTETNSQVSSIIGNTTINRNGTDVNMLTALNSVIDTAEGHTQTISSINSSIGSLTTRMSTAESKITDSAIVNTVRSNLRIGGRNLLLNSDTRQLTPNPITGDKKPTINYQNGVTVAEWGAVDAIRAYGSLAATATSIIFGVLRNLSGQPNRNCVLGTPYAGSIYIKNNHATNVIRVNINYIDRVNPITGDNDGGALVHVYNPSSGEDVDITDVGANKFVVRPGKIVKVVLTGYGSNVSGGGIRALQIGFEAESTSVGEFDFTYWHPQIEEGHIASDWSPSPIDTARQSTVEQLDDKISMIVAGTSTASSVVLTQNALTAIANNIDLSGKVTFNSLTTQAKADIASDTLSNIYSNGTTTIDGGKITAGSISADKINTNDLTVSKFESIIEEDTQWSSKEYDTFIHGDYIHCGYYDSSDASLSKNVLMVDHDYAAIHDFEFMSCNPTRTGGIDLNKIKLPYGTKITPSRMLHFGNDEDNLTNVLKLGGAHTHSSNTSNNSGTGGVGEEETPIIGPGVHCNGHRLLKSLEEYYKESDKSKISQIPWLSKYLCSISRSGVTVEHTMTSVTLNVTSSDNTNFQQIYNSERLSWDTLFDGDYIENKVCTLCCSSITTTYSGGSGPRLYLTIYDAKTGGNRLLQMVLNPSESNKVFTWPSNGRYYQLIYMAEQTKGAASVDTVVVFNNPAVVIGNFTGSSVGNPSDITVSDNYIITSDGDVHFRNSNIDALIMNNVYDNDLQRIDGLYDITSGARHLNHNSTTSHHMLPTMATLAFWNGRYSSSSSNLAYCNKGAFGTMATKNTVTATITEFTQGNLEAYSLGPHTSTMVGSFSVPAGKGILKVSIRTAANTNIRGTFGITTDNTKDATSISRGYRDDFYVIAQGTDYAASGLVVVPFNQSSETTWYIKVKANAAANIYPHYSYQILTPTISYT